MGCWAWSLFLNTTTVTNLQNDEHLFDSFATGGGRGPPPADQQALEDQPVLRLRRRQAGFEGRLSGDPGSLLIAPCRLLPFSRQLPRRASCSFGTTRTYPNMLSSTKCARTPHITRYRPGPETVDWRPEKRRLIRERLAANARGRLDSGSRKRHGHSLAATSSTFPGIEAALFASADHRGSLTRIRLPYFAWTALLLVGIPEAQAQPLEVSPGLRIDFVLLEPLKIVERSWHRGNRLRSRSS